MLFLADASDAPSDIFKWVIIIIAWIVGQVVTIYVATRNKVPQPLLTASSPEFASASGVKALADRLANLDDEVTDLKSELEERFTSLQRAISQEGENRAVRINERMDTVVLAIGELRGGEKAHSQLLDNMVQAIIHRRSSGKTH